LDAIAIIGIGCRFPGGGKSPEAFWRLLRDGVDAISEVPPNRFDINSFYASTLSAPGKIVTRCGGFLDQVDEFDAAFFRISPREAAYMDPQQRMLLEVAWEALEDAMQPPDGLAGSRTGVFIGMCYNDYEDLMYGDAAGIDSVYVSTGGYRSVAPGRLSYALDLRGPSVAVDNACASSLVAVHLACESLRRRECPLALAGGVNLILQPQPAIGYSQANMLAPDGRCKFGDARANGFVRSEGVGVVVLKPLRQARADRDPIYAVIRGSAVNNDGRGGGFLFTPSREGQEAVTREACRNAGISPGHIHYVEAHGTGTNVGDPIELQALGAVLSEGRPKNRPCLIGSVKTNIGHTEGAAGIAGLIKVALCLKHREIPPSLHFEKPNPNIPWQDLPLVIPKETGAWPVDLEPAVAGVSSFGINGTNAHVVLQEAPKHSIAPQDEEASSERAFLLPVSARTPESLQALARSYQALLTQGASDGFSLKDLCYSAAARRSHHSHRLAVVGSSLQQLVERFDAVLEGEGAPGTPSAYQTANQRQRVAFVFSGQGSQWLGMGRQLIADEPVFRERIQACAEVFSPLVSWSLTEELRANEAQSRLAEIDVLQPALFAVQVGLAALWRSWGISPDAVVGHSLGEVAAAHVAGALSLEDAATVICRRSGLMRRVSGKGAMGLVELPVEHIVPALEKYTGAISIAASNSPRSTVVSGDPETVLALLADFERQGVFCRQVKVDVASHSPQMEPLQAELLQALQTVQPRPAVIPIYSTVSGHVSDGLDLDATYWARNLREPVRFWNAVERLLSDGIDSFLEISPHPILLPAIQDGLSQVGKTGSVFASLRRGEPERGGMLGSLGGLYMLSHTIAWEEVYGSAGRCVRLPTYPWHRERFWIKEPTQRGRQPVRTSPGGKQSRNGHPFLLQSRDSSVHAGTCFWDAELDTHSTPYLDHHRVLGKAVLPAAAYIEMVLTASRELFGAGPHSLESVSFKQALHLLPEGVQQAQLVVSTEFQRPALFKFSGCTAGSDSRANWILHTTGTIRPADDAPASIPEKQVSVNEIQSRCTTIISGAEHYQAMQKRGLEYGPGFQGVKQLWLGEGEALGRLGLPEDLMADAKSYQLHPALLDACFQVFGGLLPRNGGPESARTYVPVSLSRLRFYGGPPADHPLWSYARLRHGAQGDGYLEADLLLLDEEGQLLLEADGLQLRRLEQDQPQTSESLTDCFYRLQWQLQQAPSRHHDQLQSPRSTHGRWLIFADTQGAGQQLSVLFEAAGQSCVTVWRGETYEKTLSRQYRLDPSRPEQFRELLKDAFEDSTPCRGVIHLWSLDAVSPQRLTLGSLAGAQQLGCETALHLVQSLAQMGWRDAPRLWLVTRGAQAVNEKESVSVAQSPLWGLGRVIVYEHPQLRCSHVDLGPGDIEGQIEALFREIGFEDTEDQVCLREQGRYVSRLVRYDEKKSQPPNGDCRPLVPAGTQPFRLETSSPGILDHLTLRAIADQKPAAGKVKIQVEAASLNFLDVLSALGIRPDETSHGTISLGNECSGTIVALGEGVDGFEVGDEVIAIAPSSFASFVIAEPELVIPKPRTLSFEEAASIPIAFVTAGYALRHLGRLSRGERILIHAAAGGVGLAAVQMAQRVGAEIFATAGSAEKREFLRSLGIQHVLDSRSLAFVDEVMARTRGQGVDVVLNSLSGEAMTQSIAVLGAYGRFLEIGKRDIYQNQPLGLRPFQKNLSYFAIDLARMMSERPAFVASLLKEVLDDFQQGTLQPLPLRIFPASEAIDAFRTMAMAQHIGKIVVSLKDKDVRIEPISAEPLTVRSEGAYLITGGLGGLGLLMAQWLATRGARHLVLVGRKGVSAGAQTIIDALENDGVEVMVAQADVSQPAEVEHVFAQLDQNLPPLKGIIHAAGILEDGLLIQLTAQQFNRVQAPKVQGAWNLHTFSRTRDLDFFVLFSSAASLLGSPGQGNYAAANAFLDALAHYRRAQGLHALSVNWGPWAEVGLAAAQSNRGERLALRGLASLTPQQGVDALARLLQQTSAQVGVMRFNLRQWRQFYPHAASAPLLTSLAEEPETSTTSTSSDSPIQQKLRAADPKQRRSTLEAHLRQQLAHVLRLAPARIDPHTPLGSFGLDSLMALELRNRLEAGLGVSLSTTLIWSYPTLAALTDYLVSQVEFASTPPSVPEPGALPHSSASEGSALEELSEAQMAALLVQELARATKGGAA
jgi:acyl transferase domain-containing protein